LHHVFWQTLNISKVLAASIIRVMILMMEAESASKISENYQTTRCNNPENIDLQSWLL
jgi:hypothetical protein